MCQKWDTLNLQPPIASLQETIRSIALDNASLKHTTEMQAMRITQLEKDMNVDVNMLKERISKVEQGIEGMQKDMKEMRDVYARDNVDVNAIKERMQKVEQAHVLSEGTLEVIKSNVTEMKNECKPPSWAERVLNDISTSSNAMNGRNLMHEKNVDNVDIDEWKERERRSKNIVIRGLPEKESETPPSLAITIEEFFKAQFGMSGINVYGAHRVGKPGAPRSSCGRSIVCSMADETKRGIILESSWVYLKGTGFSVCEDRTPKQQEACRKAYEERTQKRKPPSHEEKEKENST